MSLRPALTTYFPFELGFPIFKCFRLLILDKDIQKILLQQLFIKKKLFIFDFMKREMFDKIINKLYPGLIITEYTVLPRFKLNEINEWISDSSAIFVTVSNDSNNLNVALWEISEQLTGLTGFEVNIERN